MPKGHIGITSETIAERKGFRDIWKRVIGSVRLFGRRVLMKWTTPKVVEICVGMEINCYACADI